MTTLRQDMISDLETVFEDWDDIVWNGVTYKGIFHNEYEAVPIFGVEIDSRNPYIQVRESDFSAIVQGETVTIEGVAYKVKSKQPNGVGSLLIELSKD